MGWYLVLVLYSTSDVLVKPFDNKKVCETYLKAHTKEYKKDKNIKSASCEEGAPVEFDQDKPKEEYI